MSNDVDIGDGEGPLVNTRAVLLVMAGILMALTLVAFGFEVFFQNRIGITFTVQRPFPAPEVIAHERAQRLALEARQRSLLQGADGRLSIDAAVDAIVRRGQQAFDPVRATSK